MELTILSVPGCPNTELLRGRLAEALDDRHDVHIIHHTVTTEDGAIQWGMGGSPTLLVDGRDPFALRGAHASLSCRLYRGEDATAQGAPTVGQLRQALDTAAQ